MIEKLTLDPTKSGMETFILDQLSNILQIPESNISIDASFTQLGGHSLSAVQLADSCKKHDVYLSVESILTSKSVSAIIESTTVEINTSSSAGSTRCSLPESHDSIPSPRPGRSDEDERLSTNSSVSTIFRLPNEPSLREYSRGYPMTEMQLSLIHGSQKHPGKNIISYYETYRYEDLPVVKSAWKRVMEIEPIFRTKFDLNGGGILLEQAAAPFHWMERSVPDKRSYNALLENNAFHLEDQNCTAMVASSLEATSWSEDDTGDRYTTIIWRVHHALIDGYSAILLLNKVRQAASNIPIHPSPSFARFAGHLRDLQETCKEAGQLFWQRQQAKYSYPAEELLLATPLSGPSFGERSMDSTTFQVPLQQLTVYARESGVTLASLYFAAWALTMSRYMDSDTVSFGAVLSGRNLPLPGADTVIGPLVNTLPFYVCLEGSSLVASYLRHIFDCLVELASFQWTTPDHGYSRNFSSAIGMQFDASSIEGNGISPVQKPYSITSPDVPLSVFIEANGLVRLQFDTTIFQKCHIDVLGEHFCNALLALQNPHNTIAMCLEAMISCQTRQTLRTLGNCLSGLTIASSVEDDLVSLFRRTVSQFRFLTAVQRGDALLSYGDLDRSSDLIATELCSVIDIGDVVCLHADRSVNWIIGIYGILKAGGVYCALDAKLPPNLRAQMFQSSGATVYLTPHISGKTEMPFTCNISVAVEEVITNASGIDTIPNQDLARRPWANAYLCFTSGSTGKPKGVICTHEGLVAFQRDLEVRLFSKPAWKIAQTMSVAFDGSIHEIFSALSYGATLLLPNSADPFAHLHFADATILTPSAAQALSPCAFPHLSTVYLVGEPVPPDVNDRWASQKVLYNMYGPTEGTGGATIKKLFPGHPVTIGQPNPSTRIYILDRNQSSVPPGVIGEIYLAGVQVARGYINMPEETHRRFMPDSICRGLGENMYRTGDRGYWDLGSGEIICLGRKDRQIKLRGFRLDLQDLETRMLQVDPSVTAVAVAQKEDYLVAMIQPKESNVGSFRQRVSKVLPAHAVPRNVAAVDRFPTTMAGKLDYKLVADAVMADREQVFTELNPTESKLATEWRNILGLDSDVTVNKDSSFIALGGHSILQLALANRLSACFRQDIPFRFIVESATLQELAKAIDNMMPQRHDGDRLLAGTGLEDHDLSPIEKEWWQKYELDEGSSAFNVCFACDLDPTIIDFSSLTVAWNIVLNRYPILRCRYMKTRRSAVKRVYSDSPPQVQRVCGIDLWKETNRPFQLMKNDPIRVTISRNQMFVVVSHIVCDLTTLEVLLKDVVSIYRGDNLPLVGKTYMEASVRNRVMSAHDLDFWAKYLEDIPSPDSSFHTMFERSGYRGTYSIHNIATNTFHNMLKLTRSQGITLHQCALAAVALALQADGENIDILLGGPYLNRKTDDALEAVGLFLEPLPIRVKYGDNEDSSESFLQSVQKSSQAALAHAVPWDQLLEHLRVTPEFPNHPLFDIMVTFHNDRNSDKFPLRGAKPIQVWAEGSKFKLMFEFSATSDDELFLRIEYDSDCYPLSTVIQIEKLVSAALNLLTTGTQYRDVRSQLVGMVPPGDLTRPA